MPEWEEDDDSENGGEGQTGLATETKKKIEKPPLYKVLLHNDDYTSMDFVVYILKAVFHKNEDAAIKIMLAVHNQGIGVAGVYTFEVAEAKISKVEQLAKANEFPLLCSMEEE